VYRRADISRTVTLVAALYLMAVSTGAFAREFRAAGTPSEGDPTVQALRCMDRPVEQRSRRPPPDQDVPFAFASARNRS
jgi:hypothetical protein